jgi:farnesyl-diphosphate farnesyltransferase
MVASMDQLLVKTSRTFALAIPLLPEPTRRPVCLSYLLFRTADTLEDADLWPRSARLSALEAYAELMEEPTILRASALSRSWASRPPTAEPGCIELIEATPDLVGEMNRLGPEHRRRIFFHARRTALGMRDTIAKANDAGRLALHTLDELRAYCYVVAGIVGELLTDLFVLEAPALEDVRSVLADHQVAFGEGLQLVNILKDASRDAAVGRAYVPSGVSRSEVIALARADLQRARLYIHALERARAPRGFVGFTTFTADLADATLDLIARQGPGAKLSRSEVVDAFERLRTRP